MSDFRFSGKADRQAFDRFCNIADDEARLALGIDTLRAAYRAAGALSLTGWQGEIGEYIYALEHDQPLNRPL